MMSSDVHGNTQSKSRTLAKQEAFLAAYEVCGTITHAASAAGIERKSVYNWQGKDMEGFRARFAEAQRAVQDRLEHSAIKRAAHGLRRYKFDKNGEPIMLPPGVTYDEHGEIVPSDDPDAPPKPYFEYVFSDVLTIFMLKAMDPAKYRERYEVESKVQFSEPVRLIVTTKEEADLVRKMKERANANGSSE